MAFYHTWDIKNGFAHVLSFFSIISEGLWGVICKSKNVLLFRGSHHIFPLQKYFYIETTILEP